jgi:2-polyprenyl-6-methoxyphenol hydroxylase-like FAD-dependent oxidoreductase
MVSTHCHVIVIGAGIGGLTAALSLQRHGFKVSVYEQVVLEGIDAALRRRGYPSVESLKAGKRR